MVKQVSIIDDLDSVFGFCNEKTSGGGEDSFFYSINEKAGILSVFDGCGGSGSTRYQSLGNHTGAYIASRATAAAVEKWFNDICAGEKLSVEALKHQIVETLKYCIYSAELPPSKLKGSNRRILPTTASILLVTQEDSHYEIATISAGDSRTYILLPDGLKQLSRDDLRNEDAMTDIYNGAPMTNVISAEEDFRLNIATRSIVTPFVAITATDGCFNYFLSPMEFEEMILRTLMEARSIDSWNAKLQKSILEVTGDDQSMVVAVWGFQTFEKLKEALRDRWVRLTSQVVRFATDDFRPRETMWGEYKRGYYSLADGGVPAIG